MSPLAAGASAVLGLWLAASICYVSRIPRLQAAARRVNWFRTFAQWTMFDEEQRPGDYGGYSLEYRDARVDQPAGRWQVASLSYQRHPAGFLLDLHRHVADALFTLGLRLETCLESSATSDVSAAIRRIQHVLERHLEATRPPQFGLTREIRLVKRFGRRRTRGDVVLCSFAAARRV